MNLSLRGLGCAECTSARVNARPSVVLCPQPHCDAMRLYATTLVVVLLLLNKSTEAKIGSSTLSFSDRFSQLDNEPFGLLPGGYAKVDISYEVGCVHCWFGM